MEEESGTAWGMSGEENRGGGGEGREGGQESERDKEVSPLSDKHTHATELNLAPPRASPTPSRN